jgi:chitin disaccharide deacetylase
MKYLIVNADDFGASRGINRGILEAHRRGVLTSTSLMVNMPASEEAALLSRDAPELSVGLHVNFTNEGDPSALDLTGPERWRHELEHQFARFQELMGCLPTHLDSHHNIHRKPQLLPFFLEAAEAHGLPMREHSPVRYFSKFYGQWDGGTHAEWLGTENLMQMLSSEVRDGFTELSCHVGYIDAAFHSLYSLERELELQTICDPALRTFLAEQQIHLVSFRDVPAEVLSF